MANDRKVRARRRKPRRGPRTGDVFLGDILARYSETYYRSQDDAGNGEALHRVTRSSCGCCIGVDNEHAFPLSDVMWLKKHRVWVFI